MSTNRYKNFETNGRKHLKTFRIGDTVKLKNYKFWADHKRHEGEAAEVIDVDSSGNNIKIEWKNLETSYCHHTDLSQPYKTYGNIMSENINI